MEQYKNQPSEFDQSYAAVRRAIIGAQFSHLNDKQRQAVYATEGPLLILAGAGSGKTTVLIERIVNLLHFGCALESAFAPPQATAHDLLFLEQYLAHPTECDRDRAEWLCAVEPARPWEILAITFTNKAARELRERLVGALGNPEMAGKIWAHTFHTACLRILRRFGELLGFPREFTIYDTDDQRRVLTTILKEMNLNPKMYEVNRVAGMISRAKDRLLTPEQFAAEEQGDIYHKTVAELYRQYQNTLRRAGALDFDDIIMQTVLLLQNNPEVLEHYQRKFRYVLVDEYQDTNYAQYRLASLLAGHYQNICVVGDDDQSIYKFRGATVENILQFEQHFPSARTIRLEQNYRSTSNILNAANAVIDHNVYRKKKTLWTDKKGGDKLRVCRTASQDNEANYIAQTIAEGKDKGRRWSDYAVLYRNNVLSDNVVRALVGHHIPYRVYKGRDFFTRAEIRDVFAYLWVLCNPGDDLRLQRIINVPARKIGEKSLETAAEIASAYHKSLYEVIAHADEYPALARSASAMGAFVQMIEEVRAQRDSLSLCALYDLLLTRSGYRAMLEQKGDMESEGRLEHIEELKSQMLEHEKKCEIAGQTATLASFLEEMALYTDADAQAESEDAVSMMTMHAAKGLEFPVVFLVGMEDGLFPSSRAIALEDDLEEERRLCYVAMTRAKEQLYLTYAGQRMLYGRTQYTKPSRFLEEIPEELVKNNSPRSSVRIARAGTAGSTDGQAVRMVRQPIVTAAQDTPLPDYRAGEQIQHRSFGTGMVVSIKPMGNDALLEIAFEGCGTKRLMARTASPFIERVTT